MSIKVDLTKLVKAKELKDAADAAAALARLADTDHEIIKALEAQLKDPALSDLIASRKADRATIVAAKTKGKSK